jgi:hypothetical protein
MQEFRLDGGRVRKAACDNDPKRLVFCFGPQGSQPALSV